MSSEQFDALGWVVLAFFGFFGLIYGVGRFLTRNDPKVPDGDHWRE